MASTTPAPNPPLSKKVLVGFFAYLIAAAIQAAVPGYHVDPVVQQVIDAVVAFAASFAVKEERKFLVAALAKQDAEGA